MLQPRQERHLAPMGHCFKDNPTTLCVVFALSELQVSLPEVNWDEVESFNS
jgi:hypothetical protein